MVKRKSIFKFLFAFILILVFNVGLFAGLGLVKNSNDGPTAKAAVSPTVTLSDESDFDIDENGVMKGLNSSVMDKIAGKQVKIKFPASVKQLGELDIESNDYKKDLGIFRVLNYNSNYNHNMVVFDFSAATELTTIGKGAFWGVGAEQIILPDTITTIGSYAFCECESLQKVQLPQNLTALSDSLFSNCKVLSNFKIPDSVESIGKETFCNCEDLRDPNESSYYPYLTLPASLKSIGENAFYGCSKIGIINIPKDVTNIGRGVFIKTSLTTITVDEQNTKYEDYDKNIIVDTETKTLVAGCGHSEIPEDENLVTTIGEDAFRGSTIGYNISAFNIPQNITTIKDSAFRSCYYLDSNVAFSDNLITVGDAAFAECSRLKNVIISPTSKLENIGESAFASTQLISLYLPDNIQSIGNSVFGTSSNFKVYVAKNKAMAEKYKSDFPQIADKIAFEVKIKFKKSDSEITTQRKLCCDQAGIYKLYLYSMYLTDDNCVSEEEDYQFPTASEGVWADAEWNVLDLQKFDNLLRNSENFQDGEPYVMNFIRDISKVSGIGISWSSKVYDRTNQVPNLTTNNMIEGEDYDIEYHKTSPTGEKIEKEQIIDAATYYIVLKGKKKYFGERDIDFEIKKVNLSNENAKIELADEEPTWRNGDVKIAVTEVRSGFIRDGASNYLQYDLLLNEDEYDVEYYGSGDNISEVGIYVYVKVTGKPDSNVEGYTQTSYQIIARDIENVTVSGYNDVEYVEGQSFTFNLTVKDEELDNPYTLIEYSLSGSDEEREDYDFTVEYTGNNRVGTARIFIRGNRRYTGQKIIDFNIYGKEITDVILADDLTYTSEPLIKTGEIIKQVKSGNKVLTSDDYYYTVKVFYKEGNEIDNAGNNFSLIAVCEVTFTVKGRNNYTGTIEKTFRVLPLDISTCPFVFKCNNDEYQAPYQILWRGRAVKPELTLYYTSKNGLNINTSYYEITYTRISGADASDLISLGKCKVTAKPKNENLTGELSVEYEIIKNSLNNCYISIPTSTSHVSVMMSEQSNKNQVDLTSQLFTYYTGSEITYNIEISLPSYYVLQDKIDYTLKYDNNVNAGVAKITITTMGNVEGSTVILFKINRVYITDATLAISSVTYNGENYADSIDTIIEEVHSANFSNLQYGKEYTVEFTRGDETTQDTKNVGFVGVKISGTGNFDGTVSKQFRIEGIQVDDNNAEVVFDGEYVTWVYQSLTELAIKSITVSDNGKRFTLEKETDYSISYFAPTFYEIGTVKVTITFNGNFDGEIERSYEIKPRDISNVQLKSKLECTYTGSLIRPNCQLIDYFDGGESYELSGSDVEITNYANNKDVTQEAVIEIEGRKHYTGTKTIYFEIKPSPITELHLNKDVIYDGEVHELIDRVVTTAGRIYSENYSVEYKRNGAVTDDFTSAGTIEVTVTGIGNYGGTQTGTFTISKRSIEGKHRFTLEKESAEWDFDRDVKLGVQMFQVDLAVGLYAPAKYVDVDSSNYELTYERIGDDGLPKDDIHSIGKIRVTLTLKDTSNYEGTTTKEYEIKPRQISGFKRLDGNEGIEYQYTGEEITILFELIDKSNYDSKEGGYKLIENVDYYCVYTDNTNVSTNEVYAILMVYGKGNFGGSIYFPFHITPLETGEVEIEVDEDKYPFFAGENIKDHTITVTKSSISGTAHFEDRILDERDAYWSFELNWTFTPDDPNYKKVEGTYTVEEGRVFTKIQVQFDENQFNNLVEGYQPYFNVTVNKLIGDSVEKIKTGYQVNIKRANGDLLKNFNGDFSNQYYISVEFDSGGEYYIEVVFDNPQYKIEGTARKDFYVKAKEIVIEDSNESNSDITVSSDNGFEEGVQVVHEEINEVQEMKEILGNNYSSNVHHIEHISFKKEEQPVVIQNAKIFLENNNNYEVYLFRAEGAINMPMNHIGAMGFAMAYSGDSMENVTDKIRNNQPIDFSGSDVYLVFQLAGYGGGNGGNGGGNGGNGGGNWSSTASSGSPSPIVLVAIPVVLAIVAVIVIVAVKAKKKKKLASGK